MVKNGKQTRREETRGNKRQKRELYERKVELEGTKVRLDQTDAQVTTDRQASQDRDAALRRGEGFNANVWGEREISSSNSDDSQRAITRNAIRNAEVTRAKIAQNAVSGFELAPSAASYEHLVGAISGDGTQTGPASAQGEKAIRRIAGNATSVSAAGSNHFHSIQFDTLNRSIREIYIQRREAVRELRKSENPEVRMLADMVLALAHLLMDDEHVTAEEREYRLATDPEYRREFLAKHKHDYGDQRHGEGTLRRKDPDGHLLKPGIDLLPPE